VSIRNACIIARGVEIGDRSFLCPQVMFNNLDYHGETIGGAKIGIDCFIGTNATINHGISIADRTTVGAKAFVAKSIEEPDGTWIGIPAKKLER
jgi:UDP-N-acetylglucosamine acyltransferase